VFRRPELLELALTHSSFSHGTAQAGQHNERLEFLGDAILQAVVTEHLFLLHGKRDEGWLTKARAHLVNRAALHELAGELRLGGVLRLGKAEERQGGRKRPSNLSNAVEAVIGAVFLDGGYEAARRFVLDYVEGRMRRLPSDPEPENLKGALQERLHSKGQTPVYRIVSESGPAHAKVFESEVLVGGRVLGRGRGATKKEAESGAAAEALASLGSAAAS
jgi:ribonuclease-3